MIQVMKLKTSLLNINCFEKTKERGLFYLKFLNLNVKSKHVCPIKAVEQRNCDHCGGWFTPPRPSSIYCSRYCSMIVGRLAYRERAKERRAKVMQHLKQSLMVMLVIVLVSCEKAELPQPDQPKIHKSSQSINLIENGGGMNTTDWQGNAKGWKIHTPNNAIPEVKIAEIEGFDGEAFRINHWYRFFFSTPRFKLTRQYHELSFYYQTDCNVIVWATLPNDCSVQIALLKPNDKRKFFYVVIPSASYDRVRWITEKEGMGGTLIIDEVNLTSTQKPMP